MSVQPLAETGRDRTRIELSFAGEAIVLDASGALYLPDHRTLIVSDLHLEKGSYFAARGTPMPRHDTRDTLLRLARAIAFYQPACLVCLGDSFHDLRADRRMEAADAVRLGELLGVCQDWVWITGNHDPQISPTMGGRCAVMERAGTINLIHQPEHGLPPLIAGHYHPKCSIRAAGRSVSGSCFAVGEQLLLMPAFGAYAGGLSIRSGTIASLFGEVSCRAAMIYREKIWFLE
jgi:DNA ligase-associated metallophosphoesterase